ncbi:hypothetical protein GCM10027422_21080 [Hymenobacter arcticus]
MSLHVWRQCNTMAVARNFYEESMNILAPRVDRRNTTDGVTGMQFPSYEYLVAIGYQVVGFHEALPRLINWVIYMLGVVAFYHLAKQVSGSVWLGAVGAWGLAWSPEVYYHGVNALPDILALTASLAGLLWFGRWRENKRVTTLVISLLFVTLAGLTKLQFLVIGFPIAVFVLRDLLQRRYSGLQVAQLVGYAVVSVGVTLAWYAYALRLIASSGLADFGLEIRPAPDLATGWFILKRNLISDLPEVILGYGSLVLFVVGLWRLVRRAPMQHPWFGPGLAWGAGLLAYYFIELNQMRSHAYYLLPLLPVLLLLAAWGGAWLRRFPRARPLLVVALLIQPLWAVARIDWGRWVNHSPDVAPELFDPATRAALAAATPPGARCVVGPDDSGCISFYFLHKKGFGFDEPGQLAASTYSGNTYLADCVAGGARYLYTTDTLGLSDPKLQPNLAREVKRVGRFRVWALQAAPAQH